MLEYILMSKIYNLIDNNIPITNEVLTKPICTTGVSINWLDRKMKDIVNKAIIKYGPVELLKRIGELSEELHSLKSDYLELYLLEAKIFYQRIENYYMPEIYYKLFCLFTKNSLTIEDIKRVFSHEMIDVDYLLGIAKKEKLEQISLYYQNYKKSKCLKTINLEDISNALLVRSNFKSEIIEKINNLYGKEELKQMASKVIDMSYEAGVSDVEIKAIVRAINETLEYEKAIKENEDIGLQAKMTGF